MMVSSSAGPNERVRCEDVGVSAYLVKPIDQREMLQAIRRSIATDRRIRPAHPGPLLPAERPARLLDVLLAEDNIVNRRLAVALLERRGHRVTTVVNGREALSATAAQAFDIVLMDVQMPEMGGLEAATLIRARERGSASHVPIVAMTAHAMKGDRERCLEAGMDDYLAKPLEPKLVYEVIERAAGASTAGPAADSGEPACDCEVVLARVGGDRALLVEICQLFLQELPGHLTKIRAALDAGAADSLRASAHTLKGAASNFSAPLVVGAALRLERAGESGDLGSGEELWTTLKFEADRLARALERVA
jgi:CheY-like chemotaxis protein/HPt (histidine-containing phosphotransfer) domain-containing protein